MKLQQKEYEARTAALTAHLVELGLSGVVLFDPAYVLYYVGFAFVPTERPMAFLLNADGEGGLLVPRLEREHAQANALVSHVADYPEYPGETHPMESLRKLLDEMHMTGKLGADQDGYPWILGYRGQSLTELTGTTPGRITAFVEDQLAIKSAGEIALIRESSKWGNLAHTLLQRYTRPG
ncbi:MAG: Xaa-Pro dipeptidase, partial [Gaiellaceae bacterium]|nr:Xaa-Pro dipeptidase [Gaiellaceae bacterium]